MNNLLQGYLKTGIIQFGSFQQPDGTFWPIKTNFLLLPSYPDLIHATAKTLAPILLNTGCDRLLTTRATIPLGAVLSVEANIPLTYPYGEAQAITNAFVIEGAYDVGHPTTLLTDVLNENLQPMLSAARQVGLHIHDVLCIFTLRRPPSIEGIRIHSLLDFAAEIETLDTISPHLRRVVIDWLAQ